MFNIIYGKKNQAKLVMRLYTPPARLCNINSDISAANWETCSISGNVIQLRQGEGRVYMHTYLVFNEDKINKITSLDLLL